MSTRDTMIARNPTNPLYNFRLAFTFAIREMRAGVRGFLIFLACLALGVAAIAGVNALSASLVNSISTEGKTILGGDIRFSLIHRETTPEERQYLDKLGSVAATATMRSMARLPDGSDQALSELKSVDQSYPLYGSVSLASGDDLHARLVQVADGVFGGVVEPAFLARLGRKIGDTINLGDVQIKLTDVIEHEPDRLAGGGVEFGPRLMISTDAIRASGLVQPGSLVRWHYHLRLDEGTTDSDVVALRDAAAEEMPQAGWRVRTRDNASPGLSRNIERFAQFLTLVGLTALVVGGVGVANAVTAYLDSKREVIATFKSVGAIGSFVFTVYVLQILVIASIAVAIGLLIGAFVPSLAGFFLKEVLPIDLDTKIPLSSLALAAIYGYLMALVFALWPLSQAREIPPTSLFRTHDRIRLKPRLRYLIALFGCIALLFALAIGLSDDRQIATSFTFGTVFAFALLRFTAFGIMRMARSLPHARSTVWRLAIGNIHRPGAITPSVVISLGLGLSLLVTIALIDSNLRNQLTNSIADNAPNFFFADVQNHQIETFETLLFENTTNATLQRVPMLRGFFVDIAGKKPWEISVPPESAWALRGDRGVTYSARLPENSVIHEGEWWDADYDGPSLVSFEEEVARHFGLKIGDQVTVNVLGREITATVANTRKLEWQTLGINFLMVFSPNTFTGAPHSHLATLTFEEGGTDQQEFALMRTVTQAFPTVTTVRVKDALERAADIVGQLAWAIRGASAVTLISSVLVLAGALAAGHRTQIYDAVVLKTLGATRRQLITTCLLQFTLLGLITAVLGILFGTVASWYIIENIMDGTFTFYPGETFGAIGFALILCITLGFASTWRILSQKAAPILRNA